VRPARRGEGGFNRGIQPSGWESERKPPQPSPHRFPKDRRTDILPTTPYEAWALRLLPNKPLQATAKTHLTGMTNPPSASLFSFRGFVWGNQRKPPARGRPILSDVHVPLSSPNEVSSVVEVTEAGEGLFPRKHRSRKAIGQEFLSKDNNQARGNQAFGPTSPRTELHTGGFVAKIRDPVDERPVGECHSSNPA